MKKKQLLILIASIVLIALTYSAYNVFKKRSVTDNATSDVEAVIQPETVSNLDTNDGSTDATEEGDEIDPEIINEADGDYEDNIDENVPDEAFLDISDNDCNNGCKNLKDSEDIKYCKEYCGINIKPTSENCDDLESLDQDYCIKNKAIANDDINSCNKIADPNIKKSCQVMITDKILENNLQQ